MNGKTSKLINQYANACGLSKRAAKRRWKQTPKEERRHVRQFMRAVVESGAPLEDEAPQPNETQSV